MQRIYDASREKVSQLGRSLELDAAAPDGGTGPSGIDLEQARLALQEEDKFDKELFRQRIKVSPRNRSSSATSKSLSEESVLEFDFFSTCNNKARHREERLKAKEGRRHRAEAGDARDDDAEDGSGDDDGGGDDGGDDDAALAEIIDALPDPDRIYGSAEADDDDDVYRGPTGPAPPKYGTVAVHCSASSARSSSTSFTVSFQLWLVNRLLDQICCHLIVQLIP